MKKRELLIAGGVEHECPHCKGDGQHHGPIPWANCLRCGGYGTIVLTQEEVKKNA